MRRFVLVLFVFGLSAPWLIAQINTNIINQITLGGTLSENSGKIIHTSDSCYIFVGSTRSSNTGDLPDTSFGYNDTWIIKLNSQLQVEWQKLLGGSEWEEYPFIIDHENAFYVFSYSNSPVSGVKTVPLYSIADFWVIKIDYSGNEIWQKAYYPDASFGVNEMTVVSASDNIVFASSTRSGIGGMKTDTCRGFDDVWMLSIDTAGNLLWEKTIGGSYIDRVSSLNYLENQNVLIVNMRCSSGVSGDIQIPQFESFVGLNDYMIIVLDLTSGSLLNQYRFGGSADDDIIKTIEYNSMFYSFGTSASDTSSVKSEHNRGAPGTTTDFYMIKYKTDGTVITNKTIGGVESEYLSDVHQVDDNQFILLGSSNSPASGDKTEVCIGLTDYYIMSVDTNFNILWQKVIGSEEEDNCTGLLPVDINHYVILGYSSGGISGDKTGYSRGMEDFWLVEISNNLSVENFSPLMMSVFPNPATTILNLDLPNGTLQGLVYVFNSAGVIVKSAFLNAGQNSIDVSGLVAGNYFISFIPETGQSYSGQFVKE